MCTILITKQLLFKVTMVVFCNTMNTGRDACWTSAYMAFHAESLAGIELHCSADHSASLRLLRQNGGHHFPVAESALPAVDEPPADVPSSPCFCVAAYVASLLTL